MSVSNWFVEFVNADIPKRKSMLANKNKHELENIAVYFSINPRQNCTNLRNALMQVRRLPI